MRIGLDATPLLGARTGIGRYTSELIRHLPQALSPGDDVVATAFTARGQRALADVVPAGVQVRSRPAPARLLQAWWGRGEHPRVGLLAGRLDLFHGTNFVLPPPGRAAGVVTVHDLAYLRMPEHVSAASRRYADLVPRSLRRAAVVTVPSEAVAREVAETYGVEGERIVTTPLGVSREWTTTSAPSPEWLRSQGLDAPYLLFIGNQEPRKDLPTVVAALRLLHARRSADVPLLALAGPSGWGAPLALDGLPEDGVVRLGHRPDAELRALVAGARALVYPSRYEGFGLPLLEAFACGTPVVASDIPTTREVLAGSSDLAALFPVGDVEQLAGLLADPTTAGGTDQLARTRRRQLASARTWEATAQATVAAYRRALG